MNTDRLPTPGIRSLPPPLFNHHCHLFSGSAPTATDEYSLTIFVTHRPRQSLRSFVKLTESIHVNFVILCRLCVGLVRYLVGEKSRGSPSTYFYSPRLRPNRIPGRPPSPEPCWGGRTHGGRVSRSRTSWTGRGRLEG